MMKKKPKQEKITTSASSTNDNSVLNTTRSQKFKSGKKIKKHSTIGAKTATGVLLTAAVLSATGIGVGFVNAAKTTVAKDSVISANTAGAVQPLSLATTSVANNVWSTIPYTCYDAGHFLANPKSTQTNLSLNTTNSNWLYNTDNNAALLSALTNQFGKSFCIRSNVGNNKTNLLSAIKVMNAYYATQPQFNSSNVEFSALELTNTCTGSLVVNVELGATVISINGQTYQVKPSIVSIDQNASVWVYLTANGWQTCNNINSFINVVDQYHDINYFAALATVPVCAYNYNIANKQGFQINNNNQVISYSSGILAPQSSPYKNAQNLFTKIQAKNIILTDLMAMEQYLNENGVVLHASAFGQQASISFSGLNFALSQAVFTPASFANGVYHDATLEIPQITGQLSINVKCLPSTMHLEIENKPGMVYSKNLNSTSTSFPSNDLVFKIQPVLMQYQITNHVAKLVNTFPAVSTDNLSTGVTFSNSGSASETSYVLGYSISSLSSTNPDSGDVNLYQNVNGTLKPFTLVPVNWSYLFYNFWTLSHPNLNLKTENTTATFSFGSIASNRTLVNSVNPSFSWTDYVKNALLNPVDTLNVAASAQFNAPNNAWMPLPTYYQSVSSSAKERLLQNVFCQNLVLPQDSQFLQDIITQFNLNNNYNQNANNYVVKLSTYPLLVQAFLQANPWLNSYLSNQTLTVNSNLQVYLAFSMVNSSNGISIFINHIGFAYDVNQSSAIYYLPINLKEANNNHLVYLGIFPTTPTTKTLLTNQYIQNNSANNLPVLINPNGKEALTSLVSWISVNNLPVQVAINQAATSSNANVHVLKNLSLNNLVLSVPTSLKNQYLTVSDAYNLLQENNFTSTPFYLALKQELSQILLGNNSVLTLNNLTFSFDNLNNTFYCTGFNLLNSSRQLVVIANYTNFQNASFNNVKLFPNQALKFSNLHLTVNGFVPVLKMNNIQDISNFSAYPNLLSTNFATLNGNASYLAQMNLVLSQVFFANNLQVLNYTLNTNNTSLPTPQTTLTFTTITVKSAKNVYLQLGNNTKNMVLIKANENTTLKNFTLMGFKTTLSKLNNAQIFAKYQTGALNFVKSLTPAEIQNDFMQLKNVPTINAKIPCDSTVNYTNFTCEISSFNPQTLEGVIKNIAFGVSGVAYHDGIWPSYGVNTNSTNVAFKLVPMIFYKTVGSQVLHSYPSVSVQSFMYMGGVVDGNVAISTSLQYDSILPDTIMMCDIRYGYFVEPIHQINYPVSNNEIGAGDGLFIPTISGGDHFSKPYINLSYMLNSYVMMQQFNQQKEVVNNAYGSLASPKVTPYVNSLSNINVYGQGLINIPNSLNMQNWNLGYWTIYYNNPLTFVNDFMQTFGLNKYRDVKITTIAHNGLNAVTSFVVQNDTDQTLKFVQNNQVRFVFPYTNNLINFTVNTNAASCVTYNITMNVTTLYDQGNSGAVNLWNATRYLADSFAYLYPLVWNQDNYNCLSYDAGAADWYWNQGNKVFVMTQQSWTAYIDGTKHAQTIELNWVSKILGLVPNDQFEGYQIQVINSNDLLISQVLLNNQWLKVQINLIPGNSFSLA